MILNQLKAHLEASEPLTREFVALMDASFRFYSDTRSLFLEKLPQHLLQSELISLINVEIKERLFNDKFCSGINDARKSIQRVIIKLENLRRAHPDHPDSVNNLTKLAVIAERVESLYQKHWEYYRYQGRINEEDLVTFLLEIDQVAYQWDLYLSGFAAIGGLSGELSGRSCPADMSPLVIAYHREPQQHFSAGTLREVIAFLEAGYRFICAAAEIDLEENPLSLMQVEVADPVVLSLSVPGLAAATYRKFLQYLFLKDMLKRDALLKVVFESIGRDVRPDKPLPSSVLSASHKEMTAALKKLPTDGTFTISDRSFPEDGIRVLQEFTAELDGKNIRYDTMLRREPVKASRGARAGTVSKSKSDQPSSPAPPNPPLSKTGTPGSLFQAMDEKEHIAVLTDRKP